MYTITIERVETKLLYRSREWVKLEDKPDGEAVLGYAPLVKEYKEVNTELFKQTLKHLDLPRVIKAINNM